MARSINNLLNKKGWTGEEVGKALIASMLNDIKNQGKAYQPLFTQDDFDKMESSLSTDRDYLFYGVYRNIYSSVIDSFNRGQGLYQQFFNGYSRLLSEFREIQKTENAQKALMQYPLIVTAEQYKRLEAKARARLSANTESFSSLIFGILNFISAAEPESMPSTIADAVEAAKKEPAKNSFYTALYNPTFGEGYYSLPDGRRSDKMSDSEWQSALQELYFSAHRLTTDNKPTSPEETLRYCANNRFIKGYELLFKGAEAIRAAYRQAAGLELSATDDQLINALDSIIDGTDRIRFNTTAHELAQAFGFDTPAQWHAYDSPPVGLTQYDLLGVYVAKSKAPNQTQTDKRRLLKDFKADYPALYEAVAAYVKERIPQSRELKASQFYKDIISWGELEKLGVISYDSVTAPADTDIIAVFTDENTTKNNSKCFKTGFNGIAVIQNPHSSQIDENGDYIERPDPLAAFQSLTSAAANADRIAEIKTYCLSLINPALSYFYAFNSLMGILGSVYDISGLEEVAHFDTTVFESKIDVFNSFLYVFYDNIYIDGETRAQKREQIKALFTPLDTDKLKPSQEAIAAVTANISNIGFSAMAHKKLKYLDSFIEQLIGEEVI